MDNTQQNKERFSKILLDTQRENIDYLLQDLEEDGFFEAPASAQGHGAYPGGLLAHSLNVYDAAMATRQSMIELRPDIEDQLQPESIALAALLHDVCKTDFYKRIKRKKRNEIGIFEEVETYEIHDENFPIGHGEKSVIMLLRSGIDLSEDEMCAIRWHMGFSGNEDSRLVGQALEQYPLAFALSVADMEATYFLEGEEKGT